MNFNPNSNQPYCWNFPKSKRVFGFELAPLTIRMERLLEALSVAFFAVYALIWPCLAYPLAFLALVGSFFFCSIKWTIAIATILISYLTWVFIIDKDIIHRGSRRSQFVRNLPIWTYFNKYFPIKIVKVPECQLDQRKNYLFCGHPHGLFCLGIFGAFGSNGNPEREKLFNEFKFSIFTFNPSFQHPVSREISLSLGLCSASRQSMNYILSKEGGSNIGVLIPGGGAEALDYCPGKYVLQLKKRKGFIKVALQNGAPLVPVFSFGENVIYNQIYNQKGTMVRKLQDWVQELVTAPPVLWYGRGIFQEYFGFLPKRIPITVVVGAPIHVEKVDNPSQGHIDDVHEKYVAALTKLFYEYREKYSPDPKDILVIT